MNDVIASHKSVSGPSASAPPLGISKRWKNDHALLKLLQSTRGVIEDANSAAHQRFAILTAYAAGEEAFSEAPDPRRLRKAPIAPQVKTVLCGDPKRLNRWAMPMLQGAPASHWLPDFAHDAAYAYWRWLI